MSEEKKEFGWWSASCDYPLHAIVGALVGQVIIPIPIVGLLLGWYVGARIGFKSGQKTV